MRPDGSPGGRGAAAWLSAPTTPRGTPAVARAAAEEVRRSWRGLVISASAPNFCVGANLMLVLMEVQDENWDDVERMVRAFQDVNQTLKYLERPVVVAPYGQTLGGGAEI